MLLLPLPLPLLLLLLPGAPTAAEATKTCIVRVGQYLMDLTPLASTQFPLEYESPDGRHTYRATLCGATSVLADSCKVTDAVAGSKSACEFFGRAAQAGKPTFLDHGNPEKGVTITYAGGSRCASPLSPSYSSNFNFICDKTGNHPPAHKALVSVDEEPTSCRLNFVFRHPACCPVLHPSAPANDDDDDDGRLDANPATMSAALLLLLVAALCLAGYCGVGGVYKARVRGCQGVEALPHVDQLRSMARAYNRHVYRPLRRLVGLPTEEAETAATNPASSTARFDMGGVTMLRPPAPGKRTARNGGVSPHSAESMVALSGREALLSPAEVEEEVAL